MTNPFSELNDMECRDEKRKVEQFQRELSLILMDFKCRVENDLDPAASAVFCQAVTDAESDVIGTTECEIIDALKARISDIREEDASDDYRAEIRHMTATYPNTRASI